MKYILLIATLLVTGCVAVPPTPPVEKLVYVSTPLSLPERPTLPTWGYEDIECLSPEMIQKLVDRDIARVNYIEKLETIIRSTNH
jgi:hypothetical protein